MAWSAKFVQRLKGGKKGGKTSGANHVKNGTGAMNSDSRLKGGKTSGDKGAKQHAKAEEQRVKAELSRTAWSPG